MKIVLIEDDKHLSKVLKCYFIFKGYDVLTLDCLKDSYKLIVNLAPDVILSDYELPDGNTRELLSQLGQVLPQTSCLVMSGSLIPNLSHWLFRPGFAQSYFILKPFTLSSLQAILDETGVFKLDYF